MKIYKVKEIINLKVVIHSREFTFTNKYEIRDQKCFSLFFKQKNKKILKEMKYKHSFIRNFTSSSHRGKLNVHVMLFFLLLQFCFVKRCLLCKLIFL
jgi:hypothetical protein